MQRRYFCCPVLQKIRPGKKLYHGREFCLPWLVETIELGLPRGFNPVLITAIMDELPESRTKGWSQRLHDKDNIQIPCCPEVAAMLAERYITGGATDQNILISILLKILLEFLYASYHTYLSSISSTAMLIRGSSVSSLFRLSTRLSGSIAVPGPKSI